MRDIAAVRGRDRSEILSLFKARLLRSQDEEASAVLDEIATITRMRFDQLVSGASS